MDENQKKVDENWNKKNSASWKKSPKWSLGLQEVVLTSYDEIESCREWKVESSHTCKNSSRRTPRSKNMIFILFWTKRVGKRKKGDENSKNIYKSLSLFSTFRRMYQVYNKIRKNNNQNQNKKKTKKKRRSCQKSQKWSLGLREVVLTPYNEIESCREWKVESSHMCKNSSRRTPRPTTNNMWFSPLIISIMP